VKLIVNGGECAGHGRCYTLAPSLLTDDDEGYVSIRDEYLDVPDDLRAAAEDAVSGCPEGAISLVDD